MTRSLPGALPRWARRTWSWVVPAHAGPARPLLRRLPAERMASRRRDAGHRPRAGEPRASSRPDEIAFADWTFSGVVQDLPQLSAYLADRLGWPPTDERRPQLLAHLEAQAKPDAAGLRLDIARKSAVLVWRVA